MGNLAEKTGKNQAAAEMKEQKRELFESTEARLRDLKHLEMAYEWLRNRQKPVQVKRAIENL